MARNKQIEDNHEIWHHCTACGHMFDLRLSSNYCPNCGKAAYSIIKRHFYTLAILLLLFLIGSSCSHQCYKVRKRHNERAQRIIQYEGCKPAWRDPDREWRHFDERPKSHWPFNFLQ